MRWARVNLSDAMAMGEPGKRWGHTLNAVRGGRLLYLFGGYGDNCQTNEVHVFDTVSTSWSQPIVKGIAPTPRDSHTCTTVGDNLFVFGGTDGVNLLMDLQVLDTSSNTWITPIVRGEAPEAREGHTAALIGNRIYVFGGCGKSKNNIHEVYYNDLFVLNTETFIWQRAVPSGVPPSVRDSHTCSSWGSKMIVIGGENGRDYLSDVHVLDTDTLEWKELNVSGHLLPPRAGHSAAAVNNHLFIFGGFSDEQNLYDDLYMLDVDTGNCTKMLATGYGPSARFSMAVDCLDPTINGALAFIGGCNKSLEPMDDIYILYTDLVREYGREGRRLEKLSMRKQLKMKCQIQQLPGPRLSVANSQQGPQYVHLNEYQPTVGKRIFHARITKKLGPSFTIEAEIDGMPLRGVLISGQPLSGFIPTTNPHRETYPPRIEGKLIGNPQAEATTSSVAKELGSSSRNSDLEMVVAEQNPRVAVPQDLNAEATTSSVAKELGSSSRSSDLEMVVAEQDPRVAVPQDLNAEAFVSNLVSVVPQGTYIPPSQGTYIPTSQGTSVPPSQGTSVPPSQGTSVPPSQGTYILTSQGTYIPASQGTYIPPSQGTYIPPSQGTYIPPSQGTSISPSQGTSIPPSQDISTNIQNMNL